MKLDAAQLARNLGFTPNGDKEQCQCVMDHYTHVEGSIAQCNGPRWENSNIFCMHCEEMHGKVGR
jgi:hypothetical protein